MKQLLTLTCAALAAFSATAQTQRPSLYSRFTNLKNHRQHVASMLQRQQDAAPAAKTTVMKQRVIGESTYDISGTAIIQDSANYSYIGYNGSKYNFDNMYFNTEWPNNLNPGTDYPYTMNATDVMYTTLRSFAVNTSSLEPNEGAYREYAGSNVKLSKDTFYYNNAIDYMDHFYGIYDAQGKMTKLYDLYYSGSSLDSDTRFDFYYNAQGRPSKDSIYSFNGSGWDPAGVVNFTYDASGNLTVLTVSVDMGMSAWVDILQYTHTFYPNNKIKTVISDFYDQNTQSLEPIEKDTFAYDPTNRFATHMMIYQYNMGSWDPMYQSDKHLNAQGLPDTVTNRSWNGSSLAISDKVIYTYNSYGNPTTGKTFIYTGSAFDPWSLHNYYYEDFNDLSGVEDKVTKATDFKLYPNPAKEQVNISSKASIGQLMTVDVINVSGQLLSKDRSVWDSETKTISLSGLQPGIYWVRVSNNAGPTLYHQAILKQ